MSRIQAVSSSVIASQKFLCSRGNRLHLEPIGACEMTQGTAGSAVPSAWSARKVFYLGDSKRLKDWAESEIRMGSKKDRYRGNSISSGDMYGGAVIANQKV